MNYRYLLIVSAFLTNTATATPYDCQLTGRAVDIGILPPQLNIDWTPKASIVVGPNYSPVNGMELKKGFIGSTQWGRYAVGQQGKQVIYSKLSLDFDESSGEIKLVLSSQGYQPETIKGTCVVSRESATSVQNSTLATVGSATSNFQSVLTYNGEFNALKVTVANDPLYKQAFDQKTNLSKVLIQRGTCKKGKDSQPWDAIDGSINYSNNSLNLVVETTQLNRLHGALKSSSKVCLGFQSTTGAWTKRTYYK